ncbi:uncharacterized protein LOC128256528 [Drosophila gunungcola]|uniref:Uncharacterized protein n=1 Tax=Drosophila gunungcola TaxID=103775 RepID=A0A9P9YGQ5_9MUSC|nr:uncharacterized protein LOC128256528 [Drosophila gunungcola]KAI8036293.1 hypothetical protein M5D96_010886 [Drosophila gunungcola]
MCFKYMGFPLLLVFSTLGLVRAALETRLEFITKVEGDSETLFEFNFRLLGREHLLNGTMVFHVDLDNKFELSNELFEHHDGAWRPSTIGVCYKACVYLRTIYDKYFSLSSMGSNFPSRTCPVKKGEYYVRNEGVSADSWANYAKTGLNKFILKIKKNNIVYGGFEAILVLTEKGT